MSTEVYTANAEEMELHIQIRIHSVLKYIMTVTSTHVCTYLEDFIKLHGSVDLGHEDHHLIEFQSIQKIIEFSKLKKAWELRRISVCALYEGQGGEGVRRYAS